MQTALEMRSYKRLRVKMFLRSDQVNETEIADFPDASKILSSAVELSWPRRELYGLLWHSLTNGENGEVFRTFLGDEDSAPVNPGRQALLFDLARRSILSEEYQRKKFHVISGPWMGTNPRRGFPYTWVPNHLADTEGRVSPRSFSPRFERLPKIPQPIARITSTPCITTVSSGACRRLRKYGSANSGKTIHGWIGPCGRLKAWSYLAYFARSRIAGKMKAS